MALFLRRKLNRMEITWYGHSCFRLMSRGMASVVTDPYNHKDVGLKELKLKADIVTVSHDAPGHNHTDVVKGTQWCLDGPGEYEIGGVFLTAIPTGGKKNGKEGRNMAFVFDFEGVNIAHLGDITDVPSRKEVESLGNVHVLLIPVGGGNSLNAAKAAEVINLIEPGIVIPMHYALPGMSAKLNKLDTFTKQMGISKNPEELDVLKVTERDIPEETRVVVLASQT
jgi:L-ascorbate metabolism protein UlaG (beta-lactamase superfamily)